MEITTQQFRVVLLEEGIIHLHYFAGTKVTKDLLDEVYTCFDRITTISRPMLFSGDEFVSFTNEARKYAAQMENSIPSTIHAIVAANLAQKILAQYYFKFVRTKKPMYVCSTIEEGLRYIRENCKLERVS